MPGVGVSPVNIATLRSGVSVGAFDFYVDSVNGSDSNTGRTPEKALRSLTALKNKLATVSGDVQLGIAYGSDWRDILDLRTRSGVTAMPYGDPGLGMPRARCDDILNNASWQDSTQRGDANTAVYSQLVTWTGTNSYPGIWEDGVIYTYVASIALCQATAGTFFLPTLNTSLGANGSTQIMYIHPFGNTNAKTDGKVREFTTRDYAFICGDNGHFKNLYGYRGAGAYGSIKMGDNAHMERCLGAEGVKHDLLINSGHHDTNVAWIKAQSYTGKIGIEAYRDNGSGYSVQFTNCVAVSEITTFIETGIGGHTSGLPFDSWTLDGCSLQGCAMVQADVKNVTVRRTKLDKGYLHTESEGAGGSSLVQDTWIVHVPTITNFHFSIRVIGSNPATIEGTRAYFTADQYDNGLIYWETATGAVTLKRNVIVDNQNGTTRRRVFFGGGPTTNATFTGNIVDSRGTNPAAQEVYAIWMTPTGATWASNNNVWRDAVANSNCLRFLLEGASYLLPSTYFTAVRPGREANSVNTNPQITGAAAFDFTVNAVGMPANSGLERDPTCQNYTAIPASLAAAQAWLLS